MRSLEASKPDEVLHSDFLMTSLSPSDVTCWFALNGEDWLVRNCALNSGESRDTETRAGGDSSGDVVCVKPDSESDDVTVTATLTSKSVTSKGG